MNRVKTLQHTLTSYELTNGVDLGEPIRKSTVMVLAPGAVGLVRDIDYTVSGQTVLLTPSAADLVAGDNLVFYYEPFGAVTATASISAVIANNGIKIIELPGSAHLPVSDDGWIVEARGGPEQADFFSSTSDFVVTSSPWGISWLGRNLETAIGRAINALGDTVEGGPILTVFYPADGPVGRVGEVHQITAVEAGWRRFMLKKVPDPLWSAHLHAQGAEPQQYGFDFRFDQAPGGLGEAQWLAWDGMDLDGQLLAGDWVFVVYHTKVFGLPAKAPIELASVKHKGLSPRMLGEVRPFGAVTENVEPSEFAIRSALNEFSPSLTYQTASGVSFFTSASSDFTPRTLIKYDGDYTFLDPLNPFARASRTVTYDWHAQKAYFRALAVSGDYTWLGASTGDLTGTAVVCTSSETEIIPDDPKFIKSSAAGGFNSWGGVIAESGTFASGTILFTAQSGTVLGGVRIRTLSGFTTESDIYSIGTDFNRELITRQFRAPMIKGDFLKWEPGQGIVRDGWTHFSTSADVKLFCYTSARELRTVPVRMLDQGLLGLNFTYDEIDWNDSARCYVGSPGYVTEFGFGVGGMSSTSRVATSLPGATGDASTADNHRSDIFFFDGGVLPTTPSLYKWNAPGQVGSLLSYAAAHAPALYFGGAQSALDAAWFLGGTASNVIYGDVTMFRYTDSTFTFYNAGALLSGATDFGCGVVNSKIFAFGGARQTTSDEDTAATSLASSKSLAFDCVTKTAMDVGPQSPARASVRAASNDNKIYVVGGYEVGVAVGDSTETLVNQPSKSIDVYDDSVQTFITLNDMLYGTSRPAVFATSTKVHVIGGETYNSRTVSPIISETGAAQTLQLATMTWSISTLRSDPFVGLGYAQLN